MVGAVVLARRKGSEAAVITLNHYLMLSAILFAIGTAGVFLRRNLITILLSIEIMLNAVNLTFVAVGPLRGTVDGQIIAFFVMTVAAAEAAVGLAHRHRALPAPRVAQPGRVHVAEVVDATCWLLIPLLPFLGFLVNAFFGRAAAEVRVRRRRRRGDARVVRRRRSPPCCSCWRSPGRRARDRADALSPGCRSATFTVAVRAPPRSARRR